MNRARIGSPTAAHCDLIRNALVICDLNRQSCEAWIGDGGRIKQTDLHTATEYNNVAETGLNVSSPTYNLPTSFQTSRYVRISVSYDY